MSKETNEFQWDEKLVSELLGNHIGSFHVRKSLDEFKASKAPSPVIEKNNEWEIVSFIGFNGKELPFLNGKYRNDGNSISLHNCLNLKFPIHSVKRVSDGVVFTVGDKIFPVGGEVKIIERFFIYNNTLLYFETNNGKDTWSFGDYFSHAPIPQVKKAIVETSMISYIDEFPMKVIVVVNGIEKEYRPK